MRTFLSKKIWQLSVAKGSCPRVIFTSAACHMLSASRFHLHRDKYCFISATDHKTVSTHRVFLDADARRRHKDDDERFVTVSASDERVTHDLYDRPFVLCSRSPSSTASRSTTRRRQQLSGCCTVRQRKALLDSPSLRSDTMLDAPLSLRAIRSHS